ncbi:MAG: hypothetical protein KF758_17570 [Anaerolineales bacterium]|nr:hypothetical protein [Anaerolineales bacterium]MBX3038725.1 hypothetical protein [Anaerolineales bacterium]
MQKKQNLFIFIIFVLIACSPAVPAPEQPSVETIVAGTLQALTAAAPVATEVNGISFIDDNISFVIPTGIATSTIEEVVQAVPPSEGTPWWGVYPEHRQYHLEGYVLTDTFHQAEIYLYPIAEYVATNEDVGKNIETLKSLIANPNQALPERLPFLPTFNAGPMFYSNFGNITFQNGSGIRYVTEFSQFPHPITNNGMFYTFQGITNDGLYYVSAILPINVDFLVGYPTPTDQRDFAFIESEVLRVTDQLNNTSSDSFTPRLTALDSLIQSINVVGLP